MSSWGRTTYGDPCRECGFDWSISHDGAVAIVAGTPARYGDLLAGGDGTQRHPDLRWSAGAYVWHVSDNLRIWAERLAGLALGARGPVAPYDENLVADSRSYPLLPIQGALWSVGRAAVDWNDAVAMAAARQVTLVHPLQGPQGVLDVVRTNAHDASHHRWDIERSVDHPPT